MMFNYFLFCFIQKMKNNYKTGRIKVSFSDTSNHENSRFGEIQLFIQKKIFSFSLLIGTEL